MRAHLVAMKTLFHALALIMLVSCGKSPTEAVFSELDWKDGEIAYCKGYKRTTPVNGVMKAELVMKIAGLVA